MKSQRPDDARRLSHGTLEVLRQRAVAALQRGYSVEDVSNVLGMHRRTVFRWQSIYEQEGSKGLLARPITGRPKRQKTEMVENHV